HCQLPAVSLTQTRLYATFPRSFSYTQRVPMLTSRAQSAFSTWLLSSNSIWAYPTVLTLHTFGMMVLVGAALMIDLRLLGFGLAIPLGSMSNLFRVMWGAFWLNLVTGTMLFIADATKRATQP